MSDLVCIAAVPAISYFVLYTVCLGAMLGSIILRAHRFDYIWLYPLGFVLFRMATLAYIGVEAFGGKATWNRLPPGLILTLALAFLAKLLLFGPALTMFVRQIKVGDSKDRESYEKNPAFKRGTVYAGGATATSAASILGAILEVVDVKHDKADAYEKLVERLQFAAPVFNLLVVYWLCFWISRQLRGSDHLDPRLHCPGRQIYILAVLVSVANIHQIADRARVYLTGSELSIWFFWGLQLSAELAMTILVIYSLFGYKRPRPAETDDRSSFTPPSSMSIPLASPLYGLAAPELEGRASSTVLPRSDTPAADGFRGSAV